MDTTKHTTPKQKKRKRWKIVLLSIVGILIIFRIILPYIVLKYVNEALSRPKEYRGHVEDIDIALIRGAYKIINIQIDKVDSAGNHVDSIPFFECPDIDLSVQWKAIFKGRIVGEIYFDKPILNFVKGKHKHEDLRADTADFNDLFKKLMPLTINHFAIARGQIHFRDLNGSPVLDIPMKNIQAEAENLSNVNDSTKVLPSSLWAMGDVYNGKFKLDVRLNAMEKQPTFDLNAGMTDVNLVNLNPFFKKYGKFEVEKGNFGLYMEFAAKKGAFKGYVKPLLKDIDVAQKGTIAQVIWANVVGITLWVFKNHSKDQVATELPIEGRFDKPDTDLWTALVYILKNAFVNALQPSIDNTIDIGKVGAKEKKGFFKKLFGKKEKKRK